MCRIGTQTAKAVDPSVVTILAGGLYPRDFRKAVLTAGVGETIDALPVHYQNGDGIAEARQDLDAAGCSRVAVWEDESARGVNAWGVPPVEALQNTEQSQWVLRQWTDELAAGCEKIIYFGGPGDATGGWGYLMDDLSPRPVAATVAVLTSKLTGARPLGVFLLGDGGLFHLFEREGRAVLVGSTYSEGGETVRLQVGAAPLTVTDYQGNETTVSPTGGEAELQLATLPRFIEGGDLDMLKAYVVPEVQVARVGSGTSANVGTSRRMAPRVTLLVGAEGKVSVRLRSLYDQPLTATARLEPPAGWQAPPSTSIPLGQGREEVRQIAIPVPQGADAKDYVAKFVFDLGGKLPRVEKPVVLSVISPDMLGNLMPNGDFETADAAGTGPEGFTVNGATKRWADSDGTPGVGRKVLRFEGCTEWEHCGRAIPLRGGQTYLYTAWVRDQDMDCGSNMTQMLADGSEIRLYDTQVFVCGNSNPYWRVFTCRKEMPAGTERVAFTPVAKGSGWAEYDNLRVTTFEGSDFAAEACRAPAPPKTDGKLDDWVTRCPIPLIGPNQLASKADGYAWTPANLSAVGYLMWDDANLYVAFEVRDDVHHATGSGQQTAEAFLAGDSLLLGLDPTRRSPDAAKQAFAYCLASTAPGGGSGKHTLLRPQEHNGGRPAGHLFRDSSVYDMAVTEGEGTCTYELRIPLSETGLTGALGTKLGFSVQLDDNDGAGRAAQMTWGGGLLPRWDPYEFGIVTFVE
jgi:hypothetical protein